MPELAAATARPRARPPARQLAADANARVLSQLHARSAAEALLADAIRVQYPGDIAMVSSFGAESVVLLHMVAQIDRTVPVLFLETGMHFPETIAYQRAIAADLGLTDIRLIRPDPDELAAEDPGGRLHAAEPDACCALRKARPLARAIAPFRAWISGRKRHQAATRAGLPLFEDEGRDGRVKVNPLAGWSALDLKAYRDLHGLAPHPLVARGFPSIGCAPCTRPVRPGEDARAGRWAGTDKTECGIHFDGRRWVRTGA